MGTASVVDGDTIEVHGQRIRFNGIDAPESRQLCKDANRLDYPCGSRSTEALDTFFAESRPVQCNFVAWDRYHRFVRDCRRADGASVASWMVEHGQALDWPRYSHGAYAEQQLQAKTARNWLWTGEFEAPWDWRAGHSDDPKPPTNRKLDLITHRQVAQSYSCQPRRLLANLLM
ncbi:thermonuclease family protein [Mesorhizobium sp. ORS 3428]|uniref:thermonuclease family protein n=1 Tax=Mesorhizobium sp. ORS 3428 TaxID=540997 RepID=UPI003082B62B